MELPILAVLLATFFLSAGCHPKHSDVIPKDYYKRQILQPIPGYIPVYIKTEGESVIYPQKIIKPKEENFFKKAGEEIATKTQNGKSDEIKYEIPATESRTSPETLQEKSKQTRDQVKNDSQVKNSQVKLKSNPDSQISSEI